jgi:multimeric flavodoxin WrbA
MMKKLLEAIAIEGIETELILLRDEKIKGCKGCLKCEACGKERDGHCKIGDDMGDINVKLLKADALVFGTPVYFEMLSGLLKNFMDRTCPIWPRLEGKYAAGIAVAEEGIGTAIDNLKTYSSVCGMQWIGHVTALAKTKGQVAEDKDVPEHIDQLAKSLVDALKT